MSIVMTVLGLCGALGTGAFLVLVLQSGSGIMSQGPGLVGGRGVMGLDALRAVSFIAPISLSKVSRHFAPESVTMFIPIAFNLVIPVATLLLVTRKITPIAKARFVSKPPAETPAA